MLTNRAGIKNVVMACAGLALAAMLLSPNLQAQEMESRSIAAKPEAEQVETFFLKNITQVSDLNDIQTDLRNVLTRAHIYGMPSQDAITVRATPEDLQTAEKLLAEIDRPRKVYRVTFTITESDAGRKIRTQHYAMIVAGNNKSYFKQGNRVPIVTGTIDKDTSSPMTQIQYLDVGVNIEASVSGVALHTKIEESSVSDEKSNVAIQDPLLRQTTLEGMSTFVPGKAVALGSIDIPGTTRRQDIEFVADLVQ